MEFVVFVWVLSRREAPELFFGVFFGVSNYSWVFFSARSAGFFFLSFFLNKKSMDFLEFFFGVELKTLKKTLPVNTVLMKRVAFEFENCILLDLQSVLSY